MPEETESTIGKVADRLPAPTLAAILLYFALQGGPNLGQQQNDTHEPRIDGLEVRVGKLEQIATPERSAQGYADTERLKDVIGQAARHERRVGKAARLARFFAIQLEDVFRFAA